MAEWPNAVVLKTTEPKGSGGSNPSLSAITPNMITVAIIEDQTDIREMVSRAVLSRNEFNVIIESADGLEGCELCIAQKPNFVILDVMLPNLSGAEVLRRFTKEIPETRVLIFSGDQTPGLVHDLLQAGAQGFVKKTAPLAELRKGIEIVSSGGSYFGR